MRMLLQLFEICLMRIGPQALPVSKKLLWRMVVAYVITSMMALAPSGDLGMAMSAALLDAGLMLGLLYLACAWQRRTARFLQAASALAGAGALLGLLLLPVLSLSLTGGDASSIASLLWLMLFGWSLAITGHVLRHTFEIPFPYGVLAAVCYFAFSLALMRLMFPELME